MEVEIVYFAGCPNVGMARQRVLEAARGVGIAVDVRERLVADESQATAAGMRGSPTVLVAGTDVEGVAGGSASLSCRLYPSGDGYAGAPDVATITDALERAMGGVFRAGPR